MRPIHSRMPVILDQDEERAWISSGEDIPSLLDILESRYGSQLRMYEVSREVNRAAVDTPSLVRPVAHGEGDTPLFKTTGV